MRKLIALSLAAVLGLTSVARAQEWDHQAVDEAIKRAKTYLWGTWANGQFPGNGGHAGNEAGPTALVLYALLASGESPTDARVKATLEWLAAQNVTATYTRGLRANCFALAGRASKFRPNLNDDVKWLVLSADKRGGYDYVPRKQPVGTEQDFQALGRYDNSNSQLAVLGVWAGAMEGVEVPLEYWRIIERHWAEDQQPDGGWCYQQKGNSYGSMSVAGLATMFIVYDNLYRESFDQCKGDTTYPPIEKGLDWLDKNFDARTNPHNGAWYYYYLYGVERVGLASGYKYFGQKDWYKLGAAALLQKQGGGGGWENPVETSFALLFLSRGQHPVLFNKLKYPGNWNSRPRDLANITRWVSRDFERPVNWQIIHLGIPVSEWHDAPILYISGAAAPQFTDKDLDNLRDFVYQGGVILSEAACNNEAFTTAMQKAYAKMFAPYEMRRLPDDHPVYNLHYKITGRKSLSAVSNGVRLLAIHSPSELSLAWQRNNFATQADLFQTAANIYLYVSDKGQLRKRGESIWPAEKTFQPVETVKLAPIKYHGNFNPEPLAWKKFAILMGNRHSVKVELAPPTEIAALKASDWPVAAMTGTGNVELSAPEKAGLKKYIADGGTLILDAAGGNKEFAEAAEKLVQELSPEAPALVLPITHPLYAKVGPLVEKVTYRKALAMVVMDAGKPRLRGVTIKGRLAIILSPDDLTAGLVGYPCYGLRGYEIDSELPEKGSGAFALVRNIVLYASGKSISADARPAFGVPGGADPAKPGGELSW